MARKKARSPDRVAYKARLKNLLDNPPSSQIEGPEGIQLDGHFAKYACVLVSGYLEASVKEVLYNYALIKSEGRIGFYVGKTWPNSMNMNSKNILDMLGRFDEKWAGEIQEWMDDGAPKNSGIIDGIVKNRNNIAHGAEAKTTGVSITSVRSQFEVATNLVAKLEEMISV